LDGKILLKGGENVTDYQKQILIDLYNRYKEGKDGASIWFSGMSYEEKQSCLNSLRYLEEKGFIHIYARGSGFVGLRITADGIDLVENDFSIPSVAPVIQGNNSIFVHGSNNVIANNYSKISLEVENSKLPDEIKSLIETLLQELQNPNLNKAEKDNKIKQFLLDISSGTLSGLAVEGLVFLISSLFARL